MNMTPPPLPSTQVAQSLSDDKNTEPAQKPSTKPEFDYGEFAPEHRHGNFIYIENIYKHLSLSKAPPQKWTSDDQSGITLGTLHHRGSTEPSST
jgi:hypothetical protein